MNYLETIARSFPNVLAYCSGSEFNYDDIEPSGGDPIPAKETLEAQYLVNYRNDNVAKVDGIADEVYHVAVSSPVKLLEYAIAEEEAIAFKTNPESPAGGFVTSWAQAKGWTDVQAADDILATAARFRSALLYVRTQRLWVKETIRNATTTTDINNAMNSYRAAMNGLKATLTSAASGT